MKIITSIMAIAFVAFAIVSCGPNAEQLAKQAEQDSIKKADSIELATLKMNEQLRADSLANAQVAAQAAEKAKQDSLAMAEKIKAELKKEAPVNYTESSFYGRWFTKINDPSMGGGVIEVYWKEDKTTDIKFVYDNGQVYKTSSKWKYKHPYYEEVFPDGSIGKASIKWINTDKFKLTIKENQDTENYSGITRIFERKR
ncbi:MAG TPA: hypothetical protein DCQ31_11555 [Bacteroidales bacterium]|nr:hypothetical protein [Bacteroidales bacterium]